MTRIMLALILALILMTPSVVLAQDAGISAQLATKPPTEDVRVAKLTAYFASHNSPLTRHAKDFIAAADRYNIPWNLVPAISGVESTFGKAIPSGSYNAYGWANGNYYFKNWEESIDIVSRTLKERYIDRGATTIAAIARIYAPPSTTWAAKVSFFMGKIEQFMPLSEIPTFTL